MNLSENITAYPYDRSISLINIQEINEFTESYIKNVAVGGKEC